MKAFALASPKDFAEAASLLAEKTFSLPVLKAGGMDVVDHLKENLLEPDVLVNIKRLRSAGAAKDGISMDAGTIRIEATATLSDIVESPILNQHARAVALSVASAATPAVRNVATAAGNLLQRPRCWYYRHEQFECLKKGGTTCYSIEGENAYHAIFGPGPCHIVHPSNLAVALMIAGATIHLTGGKRPSLPIADLFHMPEQGVGSEHNLDPREVVTHITLPALPASGFWTIRHKQSFDWPLAMAAVGLTLDGAKIKSAVVCAGAVAPIPWMLPKVADALAGLNLADEPAITKALALAVEGAKPMRDNAYKLKLLPVAIKRALMTAAGKTFDEQTGAWA